MRHPTAVQQTGGSPLLVDNDANDSMISRGGDMPEGAINEGSAFHGARKPYRTPMVRDYGNLADVTQGNGQGVASDKAGVTTGKKTTVG